MDKVEYEKNLLRSMRKLSAGGKALLDTGALDKAFASSQERARLQGLATTYAKENTDRTLAMNREKFEYDKNQLPTATALGIGNVALSGLKGYNAMQTDKKEAEGIDRLTKTIGGLVR